MNQKVKINTSAEMSFGKALDELVFHRNTEGKTNFFMTRTGWYGTEAEPKVFLQVPDENSKMTESYLYIEKFKDKTRTDVMRFPVDLSSESLLANDWVTDIVQ